MRRAEARKAGKFFPRNSIFLHLDNGRTIYILDGTTAEDINNLVGFTASDENGKPFPPGRYQTPDNWLIVVGENGKITEHSYDPMVKMFRRSRR